MKRKRKVEEEVKCRNRMERKKRKKNTEEEGNDISTIGKEQTRKVKAEYIG